MRSRSAFGWAGLLGAWVGAAWGLAACSSEAPPRARDLQGGSLNTSTGGRAPSGGDTSGGTETGGGNTGGAGGDLTGGGSTGPNCGAITCRGAGSCVDSLFGASCVCDPGYVNDPEDPESCVVDEECVKIRVLEGGCRTILGGPPAVGLFFAVDTCAGTAVTPDKLAALGGSFRVLEDGVDVDENPESYGTVIERDVESFVTVALDASDSLTDDPELLGQIIDELDAFVERLDATSDDSPVSVSVLLFADGVGEYVPFTRDLAAVRSAIAQIEVDPAAALASVGVGGQSTWLHEVVRRGILHTERAQSLRSLVTDGGVLSSGALVVVTDGRESAGFEAPTELVADTRVSVITVGVSAELDNETLQALGRDGSFLAPDAAARSDAFAQIAQRVEEYPDRAYLLAYCSASRQGMHDVSVTLADAEGVEVSEATCTFNAAVFDSLQTCGASLFAAECEAVECGGITACGACADDQCCAAGACTGPSSSLGAPCAEDRDCYGGKVCVSKVCAEPVVPEVSCNSTIRCQPGVSVCEPTSDTCVEVTATTGAACVEGDWGSCPERNCEKELPYSPASTSYVCGAEARIGEVCDGELGKAQCERGAYCASDKTCHAKHEGSCTVDRECASDDCSTAKYCTAIAQCSFVWDEIID